MCLTADPGVSSSILAPSHTSVGIGHEIISKAILLPTADSRRVVSYNRKYRIQPCIIRKNAQPATPLLTPKSWKNEFRKY